MKRLVLLALAFLALSARATVYQPGLWFYHDDTHESINESTPIVECQGLVPCQGTFMEYTGGAKTDNVCAGTNRYDNAVYWWHVNEMFGYGGSMFVEKGISYKLSYRHSRYIRLVLDGAQRYRSTGHWNSGNVTYTAEKTGWVDFDFRGGVNVDYNVNLGPVEKSFGAGYNTNGLNYSASTWGAPPWRKFLDPGDCSLLRIVKSETDYMTLDSVAVDGTGLALAASFSGVPAAGVLTAFWGPSDGGDLPSAWAHSSVLGTVAAGSASGVTYTISGAADANFVALRLQNTNYAAGTYTQVTASAPVPKPVPTFDLSCDDIGYTNLTFTAVVASVGIGATAIASASVEIATDDAFSHIVTNLPLSLVAAGSETVYTSGLVSNTVYYARVAGTNNATVSNVSETVGPLQTLLPTISTSAIAALDPQLGALRAAVTVTDWGLDSTGARVRLEASASSGFGVLAGVSEEVDATLGVATNLMVSGLAENAGYHLRARIVNSWPSPACRRRATCRSSGRRSCGRRTRPACSPCTSACSTTSSRARPSSSSAASRKACARSRRVPAASRGPDSRLRAVPSRPASSSTSSCPAVPTRRNGPTRSSPARRPTSNGSGSTIRPPRRSRGSTRIRSRTS